MIINISVCKFPLRNHSPPQKKQYSVLFQRYSSIDLPDHSQDIKWPLLILQVLAFVSMKSKIAFSYHVLIRSSFLKILNLTAKVNQIIFILYTFYDLNRNSFTKWFSISSSCFSIPSISIEVCNQRLTEETVIVASICLSSMKVPLLNPS